MRQPETRYTKVGDSSTAYQVLGDGPVDLVYVTGMLGNIEVAGSDFAFQDRGMCALKGVPDEWQLYAVRQT